MNVQSSVLIPSPLLSSLISLITRKSRKKLMLMSGDDLWGWVGVQSEFSQLNQQGVCIDRKNISIKSNRINPCGSSINYLAIHPFKWNDQSQSQSNVDHDHSIVGQRMTDNPSHSSACNRPLIQSNYVNRIINCKPKVKSNCSVMQKFMNIDELTHHSNNIPKQKKREALRN